VVRDRAFTYRVSNTQYNFLEEEGGSGVASGQLHCCGTCSTRAEEEGEFCHFLTDWKPYYYCSLFIFIVNSLLTNSTTTQPERNNCEIKQPIRGVLF
jgi:hypothetical protein